MNDKDVYISYTRLNNEIIFSKYEFKKHAAKILKNTIDSKIKYNLLMFTNELFLDCVKDVKERLVSKIMRDRDELRFYNINKEVEDIFNIMTTKYNQRRLSIYEKINYKSLYDRVYNDKELTAFLIEHYGVTLKTPLEFQQSIDIMKSNDNIVEKIQLFLDENVDLALEECFEAIKALDGVNVKILCETK